MRGWFNIATLRLVLGALFLALLIPSVVLVQQAFQQLEYEAFFQHRLLAVELATRIDEGLVAEIEREEARTFADYQFLVVTGNPSANFVERSPLSTFPVSTALPGLVGYFQIDAQGKITTPLVPADVDDVAALGVSTVELEARLALQSRITDILREPQSKQRQREQLPELDAEVNLANLAMTEAAYRPDQSSAAEMTEEMPEEMKEEVSETTAAFASSAEAPASSAVAPDDQLEQEFFDRFGERSVLSRPAGVQLGEAA